MYQHRWVALIAAVMLVFAGCAKQVSALPEESSSEPFKTADELIAEAEEREQASSKQAAAEKAEALSAVAGIYVCSLPEVDSAFYPTLELDEQGKAVFHANIFAGMGKIEGSYIYSGTSVKIRVEQVEFSGFAGEKVTEMYFNLLPDGELELDYVNPETSVGVTNAGDRFVKTDA